MAVARLSRTTAQLLIIDVQERLLPHIHAHESVVAQITRTLRAAGRLGVPVVVSEQNPEGLGPTHRPILEAAAAATRVTKSAFSVCRDLPAHAALALDTRRQVLLAGIETHVCVQQTALDLLDRGADPFVLADAVGSRRGLDHDVALARLRAAGAVVTTVESAIFELLERCDDPAFRDVLRIIK